MISIPHSGLLYRVFRSIVLFAIIIIVIGCQNSILDIKASQIQKITISGPKFTLAWDDSSQGLIYNVYSRIHNTFTWAKLAVGLENPSLVVTSGQLTYGDYDFAISSVTSDGIESPLLTSQSSSAIPSTGWYLVWTP
jgi:hypothetical protein